MKILIVKLSAIGDVVQTLPALEALKILYPQSSIDWVVEEAAAGILDGHPLISHLLISRRKAWLRMLRKPGTFRKGVTAIRSFLGDLRSERYDIAVDFQGLLKSGMVIGAARARRKIGFAGSREFSSLFLNEKLQPYDIEKHALERYLDIARYLGARNPDTSCSLHLEREREVMRLRLDRAAAPGESRPIIAINPVARWKTKLWREENFAALADRLVDERRAAVIFTGSPDDRPTTERIIGKMRRTALNWAGETTLRELAALASLTDYFITTDTGPMHLAAAAGGRVVALFGPTAPWRTGPFGAGHAVIRAGLACSPCFRRTCTDDVRCMQAITVDDVVRQLTF